MGSINKSKSTIKHKEVSFLGKDVGNIREQFINFLMEDGNLQKNRN